MHYLLRISLLLFFIAPSKNNIAQSDETAIQQKQWKASWIQVPGETKDGYGVYLFRKKIQLDTRPDTFRIHVSADNRYKLFVNEKIVSIGPARGDITHWNYETVE